VAVAISWIIAVAANLPVYIGEGDQWTMASPFGDCELLSKDRLVLTVRTVLGTYIPVTAAGIVYFILFLRIQVQLIRSRSRVAPLSTSVGDLRTVSRAHHRHTMQRRLMMTRTIFVCYLWNSICNVVPLIFIDTFVQLFWQKMSLRMWIKAVQLCGYAFSPVHPCLLMHAYP
jgi:hypothetical protein